jgi:hypothetical protein
MIPQAKTTSNLEWFTSNNNNIEEQNEKPIHLDSEGFSFQYL